VLVAITLGQVLTIALLLLVLTTRRLILGCRTHGLKRQKAACLRCLEAWLAGDADEARLRSTVDACSDDAVGAVFKKAATIVRGDRWDALVAVARKTRWYQNVRRRARSVLWSRRLSAVRALDLLADDSDLELVRLLCNDRHRVVRSAALGILGRVADADLVAEALRTALSSGSVLQRYIFRVLRGQHALLTATVRERLAGHEPPEALAALVEMAAEMGDPSLLEPLLLLVARREPDLRAGVARALARFPHERSSAALIGLLADAQAAVRFDAANSLAALRADEASEALAATLDDDDDRVRLSTAVALRCIGRRGVDVLRSVVRSAEPRTAALCRYVLALDDCAIADHGRYGPGA